MKKYIKKPLILLAVGVIVLAASSVGATRAAFENAKKATVAFDTSSLQVDLIENGNVLTSKDDKSAELKFDNIVADGELKIGKVYSENISVKNTSGYDEYVRVMVRKSWEEPVVDENGAPVKDENGDPVYKKLTNLSPDLIHLSDVDDTIWLQDGSNTTEEGTVYYCRNIVKAGEEKKLFDTVSIGEEINSIVEQTTESEDANGKTITHKYLYDGKYFCVEIRVDAVQTNNASEAIYGAWGVNTSLDSNGSIRSVSSATFN